MSETGVCSKQFKATGKDLKNLREECGVKQREFAEFLGISPGTLATWEYRKDKYLTAPANVLYNLAERKTREARSTLKRTLEELKIAMYS